VAALFGLDTRTSLLAGALVSISSTMIVSHAFQDLRFEKRAREAVFGVLIAEDVVAILMLATISALVAGTGDTGNILLATAGRLVLVVAALLGWDFWSCRASSVSGGAPSQGDPRHQRRVLLRPLFAQSQGSQWRSAPVRSYRRPVSAMSSRSSSPCATCSPASSVSIGMVFDPVGALRDWLLVLALAAVVSWQVAGVTVECFSPPAGVLPCRRAWFTQIGELSS
jgi:predicted Kef-type K+ transport protein